MTATVDHPVDVHVEGLTLYDMYGQEGIDHINTVLAANREQKAQEIYNEIRSAAKVGTRVFSSIDKVKDTENRDSTSSGGGVSGVTGGSGSAGVALPSFGAAGVAAGVAGGVAGAGVAVPRAHIVSSGMSSSSSVGLGVGVPPAPSLGRGSGSSVQGVDGVGSSLTGTGLGNQRKPYVPLPSFEDAARPQGPGSEYVYDPVSGEWVKRDALAASVDSAGSVNGFGAGIAGTAVGAGSAVAGTRLGSSAIPSVSGAGVAGGVALPSFGTASGVAGTAGGSAVGSYFANTPVAATVTPSSSIRGAQGMAAGLPQSTVATQSAAKSGAASPAMMAGGQGAGANNEKRERRGMAYMAPHLEEEEEDIAVKPRAAMAGHRRRAGE